MGDEWDYDLWKAQKAWDLAMRIIPDKPEDTCGWTKDTYLAKAQETLQKAHEVVDAVLKVSE